jgi:hypothetical protein
VRTHCDVSTSTTTITSTTITSTTKTTVWATYPNSNSGTNTGGGTGGGDASSGVTAAPTVTAAPDNGGGGATDFVPSKQGWTVRCAFFDRILHSRGVQLGFTPLLRLKRSHACDQRLSSWVFTPLTGWQCKCRGNTEGQLNHSDSNPNPNPNPNPNYGFCPNTEGHHL